MIKSAIFLQVRLDSSRLPGKALLPLAGKPSILHAMNSLKQVDVDYHVLVTTEDSREALVDLAKEGGFEIFIGHKQDVLDRYYQASQYFQVDQIIRATGDNPLVSAELATEAKSIQSQMDSDYTGFLGCPIGTGVEVVPQPALARAWSETRLSRHREHVLPYLYENPLMFKLYRPIVSETLRLWDSSVTMDTQKDYNHLRVLFDELYKGSPIKIKELVHWLKTSSLSLQ